MKIPIPVKKAKFTKPKYLSTMPIPEPLHGKNPRTILGKEWWDKERLAAKKENNNCCWTCGIHENRVKWLEGHEVYRYNMWRKQATYIRTISVCPTCHRFIHIGRSSKVYPDELGTIISHGIEILKKNDIAITPVIDELARLNDISTSDLSIMPWPRRFSYSSWKLIIHGEEYKVS